MIAFEVLKRIVSVYSPSGEEDEAAETLAEALEELSGGTLEVWRDGAGNVLAAPKRKSEYSLALISHIDTVPGFWEPKITENSISGRGAVDAKGPLSAMSEALIKLAEEGKDVLLGAMVGEEDDSRGAKYLRDHGPKLKYVIIGEPSNTRDVVVGYRGYAWLEVKCRAKGGHASSPEVGENAVEKLWGIYQKAKERLSPATVSLTSIKSWNAFNVLPTEVIARFDVRFPASVKLEDILDSFSECEVTLKDWLGPVEVKPTSPVPRALRRALLQHGVKGKFVRKRGTSDMNVLGGSVESIAAYGPGASELSHTEKEVITKEELETAVKTYVAAGRELADDL
ncbi:N-acetyl-lysine deacetylase [Ignicoccus hospitalis]|uniref:Putative [LysW]-lysine/[LysW]-ornithine hydrolase n=1 Tax=Ignicoccus hospitalis (strain KIN4/I / DSM 18386 / JCM 14125) TaxID=453591 RepID=A8AA94_IGNH4|nr:N-acetyl-lysine deacetylase [Ignicoccus hospitalis]ABU81846.1 N2-acetyl-L-lysine deacetylase [Ignicoccus hospitalis KIN4/I]HIH90114.1 N-acetyl-lysine deacetylase [Desulfurococcaceae archaeon]